MEIVLESERIATHEAGHTVWALANKQAVEKVWVSTTSRSLTILEAAPPEHLLMPKCLAGAVAEQLRYGTFDLSGSRPDLEDAIFWSWALKDFPSWKDRAAQRALDLAAQRDLFSAVDQVAKLLSRYWDDVLAVAAALTTSRTWSLTGDDLAIMDLKVNRRSRGWSRIRRTFPALLTRASLTPATAKGMRGARPGTPPPRARAAGVCSLRPAVPAPGAKET